MQKVKAYDENGMVLGFVNMPEFPADGAKSVLVEGAYDAEATKVTFTPTEAIADVDALKEVIASGVIGRMALENGGVGSLYINDSATAAEQVVTFVGVIGGSVVAAEVIDAD